MYFRRVLTDENRQTILNYQTDNIQYSIELQYNNEFMRCLSNKECIVSNEKDKCDQFCSIQTKSKVQECQQTELFANDSKYEYFFCNNKRLSTFQYKTDVCQLIDYQTNKIHNFLCDLTNCMSQDVCKTYINYLNCTRECTKGRCVDAIFDSSQMYYCDNDMNKTIKNLDISLAITVFVIILSITIFAIFYYILKTVPEKRRNKLRQKRNQINFQAIPSTASSANINYKNLLH